MSLVPRNGSVLFIISKSIAVNKAPKVGDAISSSTTMGMHHITALMRIPTAYNTFTAPCWNAHFGIEYPRVDKEHASAKDHMDKVVIKRVQQYCCSVG